MNNANFNHLLLALTQANKLIGPMTLGISPTIDNEILVISLTAKDGKTETGYFCAEDVQSIINKIINGELFTLIWDWLEWDALADEPTEQHLAQLEAEDELNRATDEAYLMAHE